MKLQGLQPTWITDSKDSESFRTDAQEETAFAGVIVGSYLGLRQKNNDAFPNLRISLAQMSAVARRRRHHGVERMFHGSPIFAPCALNTRWWRAGATAPNSSAAVRVDGVSAVTQLARKANRFPRARG